MLRTCSNTSCGIVAHLAVFDDESVSHGHSSVVLSTSGGGLGRTVGTGIGAVISAIADLLPIVLSGPGGELGAVIETELCERA